MTYVPATNVLPNKPNLEHLREQAKDLLARLKAGDREARLRLQAFDVRAESPGLSDAQFVVAREYGFVSWPKLKNYVSSRTESLRRAIADLRSGRCCILFDDESRENEGDLVLAGDRVSAEAINFITRFGRGTLCLALDGGIADRLQLQLINPGATALNQPAFLQSIDALVGVTTGVSAYDRASTVRAVLTDDAGPGSVKSPGHIFPLRGRPGGLRERAGHTEGSLELMRLANLKPAAVICEILRDDGAMARWPELIVFAEHHDLAVVRMSDLLAT